MKDKLILIVAFFNAVLDSIKNLCILLGKLYTVDPCIGSMECIGDFVSPGSFGFYISEAIRERDPSLAME
ncbi:hypothetical protein [Oceanobacillus picturae]|uniref:hypothetical protein n=1 Tax=Oceanobacillus picturae TaxID=171693 RepID=UPI000E68CA55|nr:hypothetical protein [Oceanobacillus picturae]RIU93420.1 hypothetical protein D1864_08115 [Oceanobacillus picturae]